MEEKSLISGALWQEYNYQLKGRYPVWDIGQEIVLVHFDLPRNKDNYWFTADGDEVYSALLLFVARSITDENIRYAVELSLTLTSYDEVLKVSTLEKGKHSLRIVGWDERFERWLEFDESEPRHLSIECHLGMSIYKV